MHVQQVVLGTLQVDHCSLVGVYREGFLFDMAAGYNESNIIDF